MEGPSWLQTALGYLNLKMYEETWKALDELPLDKRQTLDALKVRSICRLNEKRFEESLEVCREMCLRYPKEHVGFVQGAYCLHEMKRTPEAQAWLQSGPPSLQEEAIYFYNLGCYDLALGNEESACSWLSQAFEMEPSYLEDALEDPDFASILKRIEKMRQDEDDYFS